MSDFLIQPDADGNCCGCDVKTDACSPCESPGIALSCDTINASKTKCGLSPYQDSEVGPYGGDALILGDHYLEIQKNDCLSGNSGFVGVGSVVDPNKVYLVETQTWIYCPDPADCDCADAVCSAEGTMTKTETWTVATPCTNEVVISGHAVVTCSSPLCFNGATFDDALVLYCVKIDAVRSSEYTTVMLKDNTIAALPAYPGTFMGTCSAIRSLSDDETSYSIQRFKPQFTFASSGVSRTLHYKEHLVPDVGSPSDIARTISVSSGTTSVIGATVIEPSVNGTITIADKHF